MIIKVVRDYSGQEGVGPDKDVFAGTTHSVTRARGSELFANGLVEIVSDEAHPGDPSEEEKAEEAKEIQPIANKAAPQHRGKPKTAASKKEGAAG